ncbi:hypothetical protein PsYK624_102160 [Phanerochaete sordida]|uniref:Uncharacterized protein n=1 Tax=Phanerochaete sordida TaxID=48140 RepID=A0A9P3LGQ1_9APHY|nr:hypothetical protein PsYK624_102160 [Phanerochaete sordida]
MPAPGCDWRRRRYQRILYKILIFVADVIQDAFGLFANERPRQLLSEAHTWADEETLQKVYAAPIIPSEPTTPLSSDAVFHIDATTASKLPRPRAQRGGARAAARARAHDDPRPARAAHRARARARRLRAHAHGLRPRAPPRRRVARAAALAQAARRMGAPQLRAAASQGPAPEGFCARPPRAHARAAGHLRAVGRRRALRRALRGRARAERPCEPRADGAPQGAGAPGLCGARAARVRARRPAHAQHPPRRRRARVGRRLGGRRVLPALVRVHVDGGAVRGPRRVLCAPVVPPLRAVHRRPVLRPVPVACGIRTLTRVVVFSAQTTDAVLSRLPTHNRSQLGCSRALRCASWDK